MNKKKDLTAPDLKQCQAEKKVGPFQLGGNAQLTRCRSKPTVIAKENKPGPDSRTGSMSLCDSCKEALIEILGRDHCTFSEIKQGKAATYCDHKWIPLPEEGNFDENAGTVYICKLCKTGKQVR